MRVTHDDWQLPEVPHRVWDLGQWRFQVVANCWATFHVPSSGDTWKKYSLSSGTSGSGKTNT